MIFLNISVLLDIITLNITSLEYSFISMKFSHEWKTSLYPHLASFPSVFCLLFTQSLKLINPSIITAYPSSTRLQTLQFPPISLVLVNLITQDNDGSPSAVPRKIFRSPSASSSDHRLIHTVGPNSAKTGLGAVLRKTDLLGVISFHF